MSLRSRTAGAALALAVPFALAAVPADAAPVPDPDPFAWTDLTPTYTATADYQYEPFAVTDGYARAGTGACDKDGQGGQGGAGYHYVKASAVGSLDPAEPAGLLYETDADGNRALVAVEWIVRAGSGTTAPALFGQQFQPATVPGVTGPVYTLRAWIWKDNPSGLFAPWNPTVTCP
ncbi:hypothetical protein AB0E08_10030 [Streptomyces sp. NPDC048281]|uniref:hypothetical protein n=1 Tax=Streptomyces sp. NPDC048281 TaxID=3154715 RepID=UPI00341D85FB